MAVQINVTKIKESYLEIALTTTNHDQTISRYITGVIKAAIDYLDDENYTSQANLPSNLEHRLCQQIAYEFRRRKDPGLSSVSVGEGTVQKYVIDEWLPAVQDALDRLMEITI
jgi:hypothetical protein